MFAAYGAQLTLDLRPAGKLPEAVQDAYLEMAVARFKLEGVSGDMLIERTK